MEHRRLHPNLARLAAQYDDILEQFTRNQITSEEARFRVSSLVARDDQGVQWCISPVDGQWYRVTISGKLVRDEPPEAGVATYTGWDLSGGDPMADPRHRVVDHLVDPRELTSETSLAGATSRFVRHEADESRERITKKRRWFGVAVAALVVVVLVSAWFATRPAGDAPIVNEAPVETIAPVPGNGQG